MTNVQTWGYSTGPASVYYERISPRDGPRRATIVMIHGGGCTGACFRATPDGRAGWADLFASWGHTVYVPDWPGHGRSSFVPEAEMTPALIVDGLAGLVRSIDDPVVIMSHSMGGPFGWKLAELLPERVVQVIGIAPGAPGNVMAVLPDESGGVGPETLEFVEETDDLVRVERAGTQWTYDFSHRIGIGDYLRAEAIGGSTRFPHAYLDQLVAADTGTYPRLLLARMNYRGWGLPIDPDSTAFAGKSIVVVTGSHDTNHPRDVDGSIVEFFGELGANAELVWLADHGIVGNGHYLMFEDNSDKIAALIRERVVENDKVEVAR